MILQLGQLRFPIHPRFEPNAPRSVITPVPFTSPAEVPAWTGSLKNFVAKACTVACSHAGAGAWYHPALTVNSLLLKARTGQVAPREGDTGAGGTVILGS